MEIDKSHTGPSLIISTRVFQEITRLSIENKANFIRITPIQSGLEVSFGRYTEDEKNIEVIDTVCFAYRNTQNTKGN